MTFKVRGSGVGLLVFALWSASLLGKRSRSAESLALQETRSGTVNWPLHNLDLAAGRFSTLDQINTANVASLSPRWLFQTGVIDGVSNQTTPVIVDGTMYVTDPRGSVAGTRARR